MTAVLVLGCPISKALVVRYSWLLLTERSGKSNQYPVGENPKLAGVKSYQYQILLVMSEPLLATPILCVLVLPS